MCWAVLSDEKGFLYNDGEEVEIEYLEILRFIGLCDRNKVEGYHKDICELGDFYLLDDPRITRCIIEWDKGAFYLQPIGMDQRWPIQLLVGAKIVGNVSENPELLEKKP